MDIMDKHSNFHQKVLLDRTHVKPVRRKNNNHRRTHTTVYPCGIQVKHIKRIAVTASTSVIKVSKHVVTTQLDMNGQERSSTLKVWDTSKDVSVKTGYLASNHTGGTGNDGWGIPWGKPWKETHSTTNGRRKIDNVKLISMKKGDVTLTRMKKDDITLISNIGSVKTGDIASNGKGGKDTVTDMTKNGWGKPWEETLGNWTTNGLSLIHI